MSPQKQLPKPPIGTHRAGLVQSRLYDRRGGMPMGKAETLMSVPGVGASAGWTGFIVHQGGQ